MRPQGMASSRINSPLDAPSACRSAIANYLLRSTHANTQQD